MSILPLLAEAFRTKKQFGVGLMRQLCQVTYLRFSRCRLDPWEYYFFQVYLDRYPMSEKRRFAGWRREVALDRAFNTGAARDLANDKLAFYTHMAAHDAPQPKLFAEFSEQRHSIPGAVHLSSSSDAEHYLRDPANTPLFIKPARGAHGRNAFSVSALASDSRSLVLASGETPDLRQFVSALDTHERSGWIFQEQLHSDEAITRFCGDRLTSVRVIVVITAPGPEILSAVWKIPTGKNITDNFSVGHSGNMIAGIDLDTGRVMHMVRGAGWKNIPVTKHPDTGTELGAAGFTDQRLPNWDAVKAMCLEYAVLFPSLRLQHWDIALTNRGPVILEINIDGGMRTHQIVQQHGIVDDRLEQLAAKFGA